MFLILELGFFFQCTYRIAYISRWPRPRRWPNWRKNNKRLKAIASLSK